MVAALPADRRQRQLRLAGQRPGGRDAVHRVAARPAGDGDAAGHRRGHRRLQANYDGRTKEPTILPARFPNLLVNGSEGIAVGMATKIPPHNLREIAAAVQWCLEHPEADEADTLDALLEIVKGPDFPTCGLIVGTAADRGRLPHRPRLDPDARRGRGRGGQARARPASSSPSCRTRSTRTTSPSASPSWSRRASSPASPTSATSPAAVPACAWSSCSSATPWPRSC